MGIISCPNCQATLSDRVRKCPVCGREITAAPDDHGMTRSTSDKSLYTAFINKSESTVCIDRDGIVGAGGLIPVAQVDSITDRITSRGTVESHRCFLVAIGCVVLALALAALAFTLATFDGTLQAIE